MSTEHTACFCSPKFRPFSAYTIALRADLDTLSTLSTPAYRSSLIHAVVEELKLHASLSSSLGIDLPSTQPNPACSAYTSFLLKIAERPSASVALILASMAPCMRLYAYLGQTLKARLGDEAGGGRYDYLSDPKKKQSLQACENYMCLGRSEGMASGLWCGPVSRRVHMHEASHISFPKPKTCKAHNCLYLHAYLLRVLFVQV